MIDTVVNGVPDEYQQIMEASRTLKFDMASDLHTGSLLKTLVASRPAGRFLELGTGTGLATAWIVAGMDGDSVLLTVENNAILLEVAKKYISDQRVEFIGRDGYEWIRNYRGATFDLIFADAMPGKYDLFAETLSMVRPNGYYIIDDMLPQPNWPAGHAERVTDFITQLDKNESLVVTKLNWSTGIIIVVKK